MAEKPQAMDINVPLQLVTKRHELWSATDRTSESTFLRLQGKIEEVCGTLTYLEREVIFRRYGIRGQTYKLDDICYILNKTRKRVLMIEAAALRKLAEPERYEKLREFLD